MWGRDLGTIYAKRETRRGWEEDKVVARVRGGGGRVGQRGARDERNTK